MTCPHCREAARCHGFRKRQIVSLFGPVDYHRHYYHCKACHHGTAPLDALLGLQNHDLTPAADEVVCLAGSVDSFAAGAQKVLARLSGLHLSESTVQRATESAGRRVADAQQAGQTFGPPLAWDWHKDADGKRVGYVSVDATGVGQQGPGGKKTEGKMVSIGMVYNPVPEERDRWADPNARRRPEWKSRYVAQVRPLEELSQPLRRQAGQVGLDRAERVIALSDGGSGLEDFLRVNVPTVAAVILDFYHVAEHVAKLAKALYPGDEPGATAWREATCEKLKVQGGTAVLADLRTLEVRPGGGANLVRDEVLGYFANQVHRMDYPTYRAKGWQIGSGPVESACKTVIGERMKGGGMRWGAAGADAVSRLRAVFCSSDDQWGAFWSRN
jgi:hypothetical protein